VASDYPPELGGFRGEAGRCENSGAALVGGAAAAEVRRLPGRGSNARYHDDARCCTLFAVMDKQPSPSLSLRMFSLLVRALGATWRVRSDLSPEIWSLVGRGCVIAALWHDRQLVCSWAYRGRGLVTMSSLSRDGQRMVDLLRMWGYRSVRGSSSEGGARALIELIRLTRDGAVAIMTMDGPRGPRHVAKPGVVPLARKSGALVLPVSFGCSSGWRLRSWDRLIIPRPFARVVLGCGDPITPGEESDEELLASICAAVSELDEDLMSRAGWRCRSATLPERVWRGEGGAALLRPAAKMAAPLYGLAVRRRNGRYDRGIGASGRLPAPVVSVGNLTVGGTGKTPLAAWIARTLVEEGRRPCLLSRGYGGSEAGPAMVSDGRSVEPDASRFGDEPVMLALQLPDVPVFVGRSRWDAGRMAWEKLRPGCFVLDDGFQHRRLHRDLDVVAVDARAPLGNGRLIPAGPLREPPGSLARAGIIVLTRADIAGEELTSHARDVVAKYAPDALVAEARTVPDALERLSGEAEPVSALSGKVVLALSGIAPGSTFVRTLEDCGAVVSDHLVFGDHHAYSAADVAVIQKRLRRSRADLLVTTSKDAARLRGVWPSDEPLMHLRVRMEITSGLGELEAKLREATAVGDA